MGFWVVELMHPKVVGMPGLTSLLSFTTGSFSIVTE
jgi:hypothetical protein